MKINEKVISIAIFIIVSLVIFSIAFSIIHQFNEPARLCLNKDWKGNVTVDYLFSKPSTFICESLFDNGGKQGLLLEDYIKFGSCYRDNKCFYKTKINQ